MSLPRYPEYKGSGAPWMGDVPTSWETRRVKHVFEIRKRIAGEEGYDILSITQKGIKIKDTESNDGQLSMDYAKYQFVQVGDFAMNHMDLLTGYVDISQHFGVTSPDYRVFSVKDCNLSHDKYFLYLFQNGYRQKIFYAFGQGSSQLGRWRFPTDQFNDFVLPLPSLEEQTAIATFLDRETAKIDGLIAEQEKLIVLLAEKRQATISHAVTKGLNPAAPMKDSGVAWLGEVPAHWYVSRLKQLTIDIKAGPFGSALTKDMYVAVGYKVYGQEQVIPADFDIGDYYITNEKFHELNQYAVMPNDILISCVGTFGKIAIVPTGALPGVINPRLIRLRVLQTVLAEFLTVVLRSAVVFEQFAILSRGGTMDVISIGTLSSIVLPLPPKTEQAKIIAFLETETTRLDELTAEATRGIALLKERRSALISAAVTGKIDVRHLAEQKAA